MMERVPDIDSEDGLLVIFLGIGIFVYVSAEDFGSTAGLFPQMTSAVVVVGSIMLLFENYMPSFIQSYVAETTEVFGTPDIDEADIEADLEDGAELKNTTTERVDESRLISPSAFTSLSVLGYLVSSLLFGMLWMSPLFAFVYSSWAEHRWYIRIGLILLSFVMAYGFMTILNLDLTNGWLIEFKLGVGGI